MFGRLSGMRKTVKSTREGPRPHCERVTYVKGLKARREQKKKYVRKLVAAFSCLLSLLSPRSLVFLHFKSFGSDQLEHKICDGVVVRLCATYNAVCDDGRLQIG